MLWDPWVRKVLQRPADTTVFNFHSSDSVGVTVCLLLLKQEAHIRMGKMEALHTIRTSLRRVRMTCGRKVRDTDYNRHTCHQALFPLKFNQPKATRDQLQISWAESNIMTPSSDVGCPQVTICCCPKGKRKHLWLDLGSCWRILRRASFLHIWGRVKRSSS